MITFLFVLDHELDANWCASNRQQQQSSFAQSTSYKDSNSNQLTTSKDNESNQNPGADNLGTLVAELSINSNTSENGHSSTQMGSSNSADRNRESNDRTMELQPQSLASDFESIPNIENKDCDYLKLVMAFKRTLVLPDVFFSYDMAVCYCTLCLTHSGKNSHDGKSRR